MARIGANATINRRFAALRHAANKAAEAERLAHTAEIVAGRGDKAATNMARKRAARAAAEAAQAAKGVR